MSKRQRKNSKYSDYVTGEEFSDGEQVEDDEDYAPKRSTPAKKRAPAKKKEAPQDPFIDEMNWMIVPPSLIWRDFNTQPSTKIAAFDLDGTLITTASGMDFARDEHDWKFFSNKVGEVLKDLYANKGYKIVVFSNQGGIKSALVGKAATNTKNRVMNLIKKTGVPMLVFMATMNDANRKPQLGMWQYFVAHCNGGLPVDPHTSFYCGDGAGRHSDKVGAVDADFANAVGLTFKLPEEIFGQPEAEPHTGGGDHKNQALIDMFEQLAAEIKAHGADGTDGFKAAAYKKVALALAGADFKVTLSNLDMAKDLPGVGKGSMERIKAFLETGAIDKRHSTEGGTAGGSGAAAPSAAAPPNETAAAFM